MKPDLEQLNSDEPTEFELRLIDAARGERPGPELSARMARGLGLPVTGAGFAEVSASKGSLSSLKLGLVVRYVVGAGLFGVALFGSVLLAQRLWGERSSTSERPALAPLESSRPVSGEPATPAEIAAPAASAAREQESTAVPAVSTPLKASAASAPVHGDLREEIRLIDAARGAVAAHSYDQALTLLQRYSATYPAGMFGQEASVLRLEALDRSGQHARAQALARQFLGRHPNSPLAERVERVAGH